MEIISLRIRSRDGAYARILQEVLRRHYRGFLIELDLMGEDGLLRDRNAWGIDLCLCDGEELWEKGAVLLSEHPVERGTPALFKYAPAREMVAQILALCEERLGRPIFFDAEGGTRLLGICAGGGGRGCSTIAEALAREWVRFHRERVLLLSLDPFPGEMPRAGEGQMGIRELLFRLGQTEGTAIPWERCLAADPWGIHRLYGEERRNPLSMASEGEVHGLLDALSRSGRFDRLLVDMGSDLGPGFFACLEATERLLFLQGGRREKERRREGRFLAYLEGRGGAVLESKLLPLENRVRPSELALSRGLYEEEEEREKAWTIPHEPRLGPEGDGELPATGDFARNIAALAARLLEV